jgi:hypothetical protein
MLGILTYDGDLLIIQPDRRKKRYGKSGSDR